MGCGGRRLESVPCRLAAVCVTTGPDLFASQPDVAERQERAVLTETSGVF
jgi:hypothetical protein